MTATRLRENWSGLSLRGVEGDEESRTAGTLKARFLTPLGMTGFRSVSLRPARTALLLLLASSLAPGLHAENSASAPSPYGTEALRKRRVQLFVMAGQAPLKEMAGNIYSFAADSEHCRVISGSQACGLSSNPLPGEALEQVFDYYVREPINDAVGQQQPSIRKQDWNWNPNLKPGR
jgi:hypothetical protein